MRVYFRLLNDCEVRSERNYYIILIIGYSLVAGCALP